MATLVLQLPINEQKEGETKDNDCIQWILSQKYDSAIDHASSFPNQDKIYSVTISQNSFYDNQTYIPQYIKMV